MSMSSWAREAIVNERLLLIWTKLKSKSRAADRSVRSTRDSGGCGVEGAFFERDVDVIT
jgi:hypothetical protein